MCITHSINDQKINSQDYLTERQRVSLLFLKQEVFQNRRFCSSKSFIKLG